jgi:hypothetical protein
LIEADSGISIWWVLLVSFGGSLMICIFVFMSLNSKIRGLINLSKREEGKHIVKPVTGSLFKSHPGSDHTKSDVLSKNGENKDSEKKIAMPDS